MTTDSEYEAMQRLIPLYANGALSDTERLRFEQELWRNRLLRRDYEEFLEIEAAFRALERQVFPDLASASPVAMARVRREAAALAAEPPSGPRRSIPDLLRDLFRTPQLAWGFAALQLAIVSVLVLTRPELPSEGVRFDSLSTARVSGVLRVNVVFKDEAPTSDVRRLLRELHARIADGPSETGLITLEIEGGDAKATTVLATLKGSTLVRFAEIAY